MVAYYNNEIISGEIWHKLKSTVGFPQPISFALCPFFVHRSCFPSGSDKLSSKPVSSLSCHRKPPAAFVAGSSDICGGLICPFFVTIEIIRTRKYLILRVLYVLQFFNHSGLKENSKLEVIEKPTTELTFPQRAASPVL